ncbi:HEAT repeat domain-containing protein [Gordonia amicalis]|uniref:HEAT repeat domain-containing protein n=1 Tax=Gordonia amicalis TaxID=89053 RepID=UPI0015F4F6B5|nr:HEAT repeat domain-containing protein [Gordonia amicalis]MBA5849310.1 HEAT repeat domain-containing protein [Gordonia amicalis]
MTTEHALSDPTRSALSTALHSPEASTRLRAAMAAGTEPDPRLVDDLVARCGTEPDFFVRDMLTWALTRLPAALTVPRLIGELVSASPQARAQALHTLSKIGDRTAWPAITDELLHDADPEVARAAWRAAVALVPAGRETAVAVELAGELGRGGIEVQRSLSRALAALGEVSLDALATARRHRDPRIRAHAAATARLLDDPDSNFAYELEMATRLANIGVSVHDSSPPC